MRGRGAWKGRPTGALSGFRSPRTYMPHGRDLRPRNQRRAESPVSMRSGSSGISERDMLHT
eukprot:5835604-Pyramimonas_sp.AAC.1